MSKAETTNESRVIHTNMGIIRVFERVADLQSAVEYHVRQLLNTYGGTNRPMVVGLSGGKTPLPVYHALQTHPPPDLPANLHIVFSDERWVPLGDPSNNYEQAKGLVEAWQLPQQRIFRFETEFSHEEAAHRYHLAWNELLHTEPILALMLLGLGEDGHTASLFTPEDASFGHTEWAIPVHRKTDNSQRLSLTSRALHSFEQLIYLASGASKADAVIQWSNGDPSIGATAPALDHSNAELWVDSEAAAKLNG